MTANEVGRNDPCPCGSGKKYKHCCMRKDQQRRRAGVGSSTGHPREQAGNLLQGIRRLGRQLKSQRPGEQATDLLKSLEDLEEMVSYQAMEDEIEAAALTLEEHGDVYDEMMADPPAAMERAQSLFSEERFASMRYSADDLQDAFKHVGYLSPIGGELSDEDMETMVAATLHLAGDRKNRQRLARQLMMALPEYVEAGRYRDSWLIQHSAYLMTRGPKQSNPFLFAMLQLAFEEWEDRAVEEHEALMRELGIDRSALRGAGIQEMEALFEQITADPRKQARVEAFYKAHPEFSDKARAEVAELERASLKLLERDDAECLFLSVEEVAPWLPALQEQFDLAVGPVRVAVAQGEEPDPEAVRAMQVRVVEITRQMAEAVFTPERIDQLVGDLKGYQRSLDEAGEREEAGWAYGALASIRADASPADKPFLAALCFASLRGAVEAARAADAEAGAG
jgi:uncharacterized protein YecA (UPF0149 family)